MFLLYLHILIELNILQLLLIDIIMSLCVCVRKKGGGIEI